ncbi:hypothetical protein SAY87_015063 [Trapa incisa]|uniref:Uncharacterized protein n=1 Tax=Trapa incisa TaxID=236973 RepID=A0AAN7JL52_9MYRT|nr:hypothetical protein SAY87_015063 [Trapa incisa]
MYVFSHSSRTDDMFPLSEYPSLNCSIIVISHTLYVSFTQKNSAVVGAITGVALALTSDRPSHELIAQCAITGAAVSTAANLLSGVF